MSDAITYEGLLERNELISMVLKDKEWDKMEQSNQNTEKFLIDLHLKNMEENIRSGLWDKHGPMSFGLHKIGDGKAVIGIGAGPSFNNNSKTLKLVNDLNWEKRIEDQPFIFICSNHQWKACMKLGIYPHFVMIVDASDHLFDHLCKDIPPTAENTILLTGLHASPKVLKEWDRQGRPIQFYVAGYDKKQELFKSIAKEDPNNFLCEEGGNVLNMAWIVARKFMCSSVFMTVGNDLSYPIINDPVKRRQSFYADGDYAVNVKNKRDEARNKMAWMGFKIEHNPIIDQFVVNLKPFWTSWQLWVYKKWMETQVTLCEGDKDPKSFHYFNCSESGILGVIAKSMDKKDFEDKNNWLLMDQIFPKRWHTRRLTNAVATFLRVRDEWARMKLREDRVGRVEIPSDAEVATLSQVKTDTASVADLMN